MQGSLVWWPWLTPGAGQVKMEAGTPGSTGRWAGRGGDGTEGARRLWWVRGWWGETTEGFLLDGDVTALYDPGESPWGCSSGPGFGWGEADVTPKCQSSPSQGSLCGGCCAAVLGVKGDLPEQQISLQAAGSGQAGVWRAWEAAAGG